VEADSLVTSSGARRQPQFPQPWLRAAIATAASLWPRSRLRARPRKHGGDRYGSDL